MAVLKIDYAATRSAGNIILTKQDEFASNLAAIRTINSNLAATWKGSDAEAYTTKVEDQAKTMDTLSATIEDIGNFLVSVGNAYEEAMNANKNAIGK